MSLHTKKSCPRAALFCAIRPSKPTGNNRVPNLIGLPGCTIWQYTRVLPGVLAPQGALLLFGFGGSTTNGRPEQIASHSTQGSSSIIYQVQKPEAPVHSNTGHQLFLHPCVPQRHQHNGYPLPEPKQKREHKRNHCCPCHINRQVAADGLPHHFIAGFVPNNR